MHPDRLAARRTVVVALAAALLASPAAAQQPAGSQFPNPELLTVMPPGGKAGTTVEVTFTGTHLEEPEGLLFSRPGFKAEPIVPPAAPADPKKPPMPPAK